MWRLCTSQTQIDRVGAFMKRSTKIFTPEEIRKAAQLAGKHAAWDYNADTGKLKLAKREKIVLSISCLIAFYGFAHPGQILLTTGHWGDLSLLLWLMSFIPGIYLLWMMMPLFRDSVGLWPKFILAAFSLGLGFWLGMSILFNAVPTLGTSFFTKPRTIEFTFVSVTRPRCDKLCSLRTLVHGERRRYAYNIDGQPAPARIFLAKSNGFQVFPRGMRRVGGERAIITGQANWFGLRVESIEKHESDA
jgi:hypothetical protein